MDSQVDLSLVETHELAVELLRRADHGIVGLVRIVTEEKGGVSKYTFYNQWTGDWITCAGILSTLSNSLLNDLAKKSEGRDALDF